MPTVLEERGDDGDGPVVVVVEAVPHVVSDSGHVLRAPDGGVVGEDGGRPLTDLGRALGDHQHRRGPGLPQERCDRGRVLDRPLDAEAGGGTEGEVLRGVLGGDAVRVARAVGGCGVAAEVGGGEGVVALGLSDQSGVGGEESEPHEAERHGVPGDVRRSWPGHGRSEAARVFSALVPGDLRGGTVHGAGLGDDRPVQACGDARVGQGPGEHDPARGESEDVDLAHAEAVDEGGEVADRPGDRVLAHGERVAPSATGLFVGVDVVALARQALQEPVVEHRDAPDRSAVEVHERDGMPGAGVRGRVVVHRDPAARAQAPVLRGHERQGGRVPPGRRRGRDADRRRQCRRDDHRQERHEPRHSVRRRPRHVARAAPAPRVVTHAASPEPAPSVRAVSTRKTTTSVATAARARSKRPPKRKRRMPDVGKADPQQFQNAVSKRGYQSG